MPEQRAVGSLNTVSNTIVEPEMLLRFSSLHRLLRITAWCLRWRHRDTTPRAQHSTTTSLSLDPDEIDAALVRWIRTAQTLHYRTEISMVKKSHAVPSRSPLTKLSPFIDHDGIMRFGGRLKHAILSHDERHPIIVPPTSRMALFLIESCHRRTLHGVQLTLGLLRHRF